MIDHVSLPVRDLNTSAVFYQRVLEALGMVEFVHRPTTAGFGSKYPEFWINLRPDMQPVETGTGVHVCLRARSVEAVKAFHTRALENGGRDDGAPGPRQGAIVTY